MRYGSDIGIIPKSLKKAIKNNGHPPLKRKGAKKECPNLIKDVSIKIGEI